MATTARTDDPQPLVRLISIVDVADVLGVEVRHVRRLVHERRIPFIKWGTCCGLIPRRSELGSTTTASTLASYRHLSTTRSR